MGISSFLIFFTVATGMALALVGISVLLGEKHLEERPHDVYETGMNPVGGARRRYDIKFYLTAILFLLFDVEIVFLFPWALVFDHVADKALMFYEFMIFIGILAVAYIFVVFSKSLDWEK